MAFGLVPEILDSVDVILLVNESAPNGGSDVMAVRDMQGGVIAAESVRVDGYYRTMISCVP